MSCYSDSVLMGLSHDRIFRRITRRVDRFSIRSHTLNNLRFFPLNSYRTNNVLNVNIPYYKRVKAYVSVFGAYTQLVFNDLDVCPYVESYVEKYARVTGPLPFILLSHNIVIC